MAGHGPALGRLTQRAAFKAAAAHGRKAVRPGVVVQARPHGPDEAPEAPLRLGLTASRRVGNAVRRNRARRRLRALAREILPSRVRPGYDIVLIARQATPERGYRRLRGDVLGALGRLELLREDAP